MNKNTVAIIIVILAVIFIIFMSIFLTNKNSSLTPDETQMQGSERYNGDLEYVYGEPENTYETHTYLMYDPVSEVCYHKEFISYDKKAYGSIVELYYGNKLLHYCPHNTESNSENAIGTFYILVNGEPVGVNPTTATCPFNS